MALKWKGKIRKWATQQIISIPAKIYYDSQFPFKENDIVDVIIDGKKLIVQKHVQKEGGK